MIQEHSGLLSGDRNFSIPYPISLPEAETKGSSCPHSVVIFSGFVWVPRASNPLWHTTELAISLSFAPRLDGAIEHCDL